MPTFDADWVDAFSDRPFGGNGCAVVHDGSGLDDATCMAFVRETSLVECTFTGPSDKADIRVRYFLASREIPFAGHPTIATVAAMRHRGLIQDGPVTLETQAGIVPVEVNGLHIRMRQQAPDFGQQIDPKLIAAVVGLTPDDILGQPQLVSTGLPFCITEIRDYATLATARLNLDALHHYAQSLGHDATDVMEPYLITQNGTPEGTQTFARLLMAPPSPPEDPFTGSATGAAACYLWATGALPLASYRAAQGDGLGRPGRAQVDLIGTRDAIEGVHVAGDGYVLMSGQLRL